MIEVLALDDDTEGRMLTFFCPKCGSADSPYMGMVRHCYACDYVHRANIEHLLQYCQERINYHFREETVWGMGKG